MYQIKTLNKISNKGLELMPRDIYEVATELSNPDAILLRSYKMHDMELPEKLKAIARAGAGVNNIPVEKCTELGIVVFNTPGANANAVKELVILGLLISSRRIYEGIAYTKTLIGKGSEIPSIIEKNKSNFAGPEIKGKKLGIIGLGAIGAMVANSAASLGMVVEGHDPFISVDAAWSLSRDVKKAKGIDRLIATSDYISIHVPATDNTKGFINAEKIKQMKDGVRILNFARGAIVNEQDIIAGLNSGKISCYVTDFGSEELIKNDKVVCLPHLGASTPESEENCATMAVNQIMDFLENGNIKNSVNFPTCNMQKTSDTRLTIINKNIPKMVGKFTNVLADKDLNIIDMLNKSKDDIAYNIIDVKGDVTKDVIDTLTNTDGVIKVRTFEI